MWPNKVGIKPRRISSQKLSWFNDANNNFELNLLTVPFLFANAKVACVPAHPPFKGKGKWSV